MKSTKIGIAVAGIFALTLSTANAREVVTVQQPMYTGPVVEAPSSAARFDSLQKQVVLVNQMSEKFQGEASTLFKNFDALEWRLAYGSRLFHQPEAALTSALSAADLSSANARMASAIAAKHSGGLQNTVTLLDNPCRIVDTRFGGGGMLGPAFRFWYVFNTPAIIAGQGGNASGCGSFPNAEFFLMYVTVVPPGAPLSGGANFLTVQHDATGPTSSTMNYYPGINIANFAAVSCFNCGGTSTGGFNAFASSNTHVVIDLVGVGSPTATTFWASVDAAGNLVRGLGPTGASRLAAGAYQVDFPRDVSSCGYIAANGTPTAGNTAAQSFASIRAGNNNAVFVAMQDSAGTQTDKAFFLTVLCN
jgi:hypothetical protein